MLKTLATVLRPSTQKLLQSEGFFRSPIIGFGIGRLQSSFSAEGSTKVPVSTSIILTNASSFKSPSSVPPDAWNMMSLQQVLSAASISQHIEIGNPWQNRIIPIEQPFRPSKGSFDDPLSISQAPMEAPKGSDKEVTEAPLHESVVNIEKKAARLVVIRRLKMNKHKRKKRARKMKVKWEHIRLKRETKTERAFLDRHLARIREAERFDAKEYVANIIATAKQPPEPRFWRGKRLPTWYIKQQITLGNYDPKECW